MVDRTRPLVGSQTLTLRSSLPVAIRVAPSVNATAFKRLSVRPKSVATSFPDLMSQMRADESPLATAMRCPSGLKAIGAEPSMAFTDLLERGRVPEAHAVAVGVHREDASVRRAERHAAHASP